MKDPTLSGRFTAWVATSLFGSKRSHADIQSSEEERDRFFKMTSDLLCIASTDGFFKRVNPAFTVILGWTPSDLLGHPTIEFVHPEDVPATLAELEQLAKGIPNITFINRYRTSDGNYRTIRWSFTPELAAGILLARGNDVTEERHTKEALLHSEENLAVTLQSIGDAVLATDAEGRITRLNTVAEKLTGWTQAEAIGRTKEEILHIFDQETRQPAVLPVADTLARSIGQGLAKNFLLISRQGVERLIADNGSPIRSREGQVIGRVFVFRDVTEEVRVRAMLREREVAMERFKYTLDHTEDSIFMYTTDDFRFVYVNEGAKRLVGYTEAEMSEMSPLDIEPEFTLETYHQLVQPLLDGAKPSLTILTVHRHKDGHDIPVEITLQVVRQEAQEPLLVTIARDITLQKKIQSDLAQKSVELEAASRIDRVSSRVMLAFSRKQADSGLPQVLDVLTSEAQYRPLAFYLYDEWQGQLELAASADLPAGHVVKAVRLGEGLVGGAALRRQAVFIDAPKSGELTLDTGIGLLNPGTIFAIPLTHGERLLGAIAGASPVRLSERERGWIILVAGQVAVGLHAQGQYQELKMLSEQLNERTQRIAQQNRDLEQANRLKSQFLANMSHELRTPLNAIIGFSEVLKDGLLGTLEDQQKDYVSEIFQSGKHLLSLINDILDLSKIEAGKMELELESLDLQSLLENALSIVKEKAAKDGVSLVAAIAPDIGEMQADGRKLRQIMYNLLSNAVKFTPAGGSVRLEAKVDTDMVEIAVQDTGIGISEADIPRLFKPFEQIEGGIDRRFEGTGLGLSMVKSLVELHLGTIGVESELGQGSRFWIRLPRQAPDPATAESSLEPQPILALRGAGLKAPTVLVIDRDQKAVALVRRWLDKAGYQVEEAYTADIVWNAIKKKAPDLVLLDIEQGDETSWDLLARLKSKPETAGIPVVLTSTPADRDRGLALGAVEVIEKPVSTARFDELMVNIGIAPGLDGTAVNVLVVDDNPRAVEHAAKWLERTGFIVGRAYGGRDALAMLDLQVYGLVILDLMMPEVTGFDVLREMRLREKTAATPVIVLTAKVIDSEERAGLLKSVSAVIEKSSWDENTFLPEVRRALQGRRRGRRSTDSATWYLPVPSPSGEHRGQDNAPRVLVVDDEANVREVLRLYLVNAGFQVETASGGKEALRLIEVNPPDLITLDLMMPDIDGVAFLGLLASSKQGRRVPVVIISGASHPDTAKAFGASAVLAKPIQRHELLTLAKQLTAGESQSGVPLVLVVDDDPRAVKIVTAFFAGEAFEVATAFGGREAIELAMARRPDLVVVDLMMPEFSGFDVIEWFRGRKETFTVPVIVLTAKQLTVTEEETLRENVAQVFAKAVTGRDEFLAAVRQTLGHGKNSKSADGWRP